MALRAGYYGLKRRIRDKLFKLSDAIPEGIGPDNPIASKSDVLTAIDLLDDTVGWISKNWIPFPYNLSDVSGSGIIFTADTNGVVDADGTTSGVTSLFFSRREGVSGNKMLLPAGTWKVVGGKSSSVYLSVGYTENNAYKLIGTDNGNGLEFTLTEPTYIQISLDVYNITVSHEKISPMVCTKKQYDLSPLYVPGHVSVAEMFAKVINLALTITTDNYTGDIDDLDAGIRYCTNAAAHNPGNAWGYCITIKNPSNKIQIFIGQASTGIWYRRFTSSAWQAWNAVTLTEVTATREEETKKSTKKSTAKAD